MSYSVSTLTVLRSDLRDALMAFDVEADQLGFVGRHIMPFLPVSRAGGQYAKTKIEDTLQPSQDDRRAPSGGFKRSVGKFEMDSYNCTDRGWEEPLDVLEVARYKELIKSETLALARAYDMVVRNQEARVIATALNTASISNAAAATAWGNQSSADPQADIETRVQAVRNQLGVVANLVVMDWSTYRKAIKTEAVRSLIKYDGIDDPKMSGITAQKLAEVFGVERIQISGSMKNTANAGAAAQLSTLWDATKVWVGRVEQGLDTKKPQFGRTFVWDEVSGSDDRPVVEMYPDLVAKADVVRVLWSTDEKKFLTEAASILTGC